MKENKFKAIHKETGDIVSFGVLAFGYDGFDFVLMDGEYNHIGSNYSCVLVEYIGLKDKNGIEIYEDDWFDIGGRIYRVIYQDANFRIADEKSNKSLSAGCVNLKGSVIGNLHEQKNPELLKDK